MTQAYSGDTHPSARRWAGRGHRTSRADKGRGGPFFFFFLIIFSLRGVCGCDSGKDVPGHLCSLECHWDCPAFLAFLAQPRSGFLRLATVHFIMNTTQPSCLLWIWLNMSAVHRNSVLTGTVKGSQNVDLYAFPCSIVWADLVTKCYLFYTHYYSKVKILNQAQ